MNQLFEAKHVAVGYGTKEILSDISFSISETQLCGILGANGCGKTTLFRGIMGVNAWVKGHCFVNEEDVLRLNEKKRAKKISLLPQHMEVPEGLFVEDIIEMGFYPRLSFLEAPTKEMRQEMKKIAESVGVIDLFGRYYHELSEGQKQIVLLVRTLVQNTPVIFMDEPDSALDFTHKHEMFFRLQDLVKQQKKAGLLILHDPSIALTYCDKVFLINEGKLVDTILTKVDTEQQMQEKLEKLYGNIVLEKNEKHVHVWYEKR